MKWIKNRVVLCVHLLYEAAVNIHVEKPKAHYSSCVRRLECNIKQVLEHIMFRICRGCLNEYQRQVYKKPVWLTEIYELSRAKTCQRSIFLSHYYSLFFRNSQWFLLLEPWTVIDRIILRHRSIRKHLLLLPASCVCKH